MKIHTFVEKIGNRSIIFGQEVIQNGDICAIGKSVVVHIDLETREAEYIPQETKKLFQSA